MDDLREKVISSLETLKQDFPKIISWQYDDQLQNTVGNIELAITLLKAQEPRVMDADEIVLSADPSKWLWVERKGDYCAEAFKAGKTISGLIAFDSETPGAFLYCERPDEYGKTWRCWTSRPTDAQREAVKWND